MNKLLLLGLAFLILLLALPFIPKRTWTVKCYLPSGCDKIKHTEITQDLFLHVQCTQNAVVSYFYFFPLKDIVPFPPGLYRSLPEKITFLKGNDKLLQCYSEN